MSDPIIKPTEEFFIPKGSIALSTPDYNFQHRIGIQGPGGTGKSHAGTTFSYPMFLSYDRGLISHIGREDIYEVPFYDGKFVDTIRKRDGLKCPPNQKDALIDFLTGENYALKLTSKQHLILDASTGIQAAYHMWWEQNKEEYVTAQGAVDARKEWNLKLKYFQEIFFHLKALKCNIIYLCHESPDRDDKGNLTGGVRPLLTGQFQDELMTHFTDWFRAHAVSKPVKEKETEFRSKYKLSDADFKEWMLSGTNDTIYLWQTQSDNIAKCKTSMSNAPKFVLAHADTLKRYKKKTPAETAAMEHALSK